MRPTSCSRSWTPGISDTSQAYTAQFCLSQPGGVWDSASTARPRIKRSSALFFWLLRHTLNPVVLRAARSGRAFSLVRHIGRRTGRTYETPLIVAPVGDGFVAELTYGTDVAWYRNVVAAGRCVLVFKGVEYPIDGIKLYPAEAGRRAFGFPAQLILRLPRRHEFRFLRIAKDSSKDKAPRSRGRVCGHSGEYVGVMVRR